MNCIRHPDRAASAFCQHCGKPLCPECTRGPSAETGGLLLCGPCFEARLAGGAPFASGSAAGSGVPASSSSWSTVSAPGSAPGSAPVSATGSAPGSAPGTPFPAPPYRRSSPSPFLAGLLGFIPGVGAMYNGQFVKALIHVVIFVVLISISQQIDVLGILVFAWIMYQVFDAAQTAAARRDGLPLPDPFGILEFSQRVGPPPAPGPMPQAAYVPVPGPPPSAAFAAPASAALGNRGEPVGAILLIAVGCLLLGGTLGILDADWISRGWPVLLLVLGLWLLIRRVAPAVGAPPFRDSFRGPSAASPGSGAGATPGPLSGTPYSTPYSTPYPAPAQPPAGGKEPGTGGSEEQKP